jgi:peptidoglycan/xylan/chitin deacetylase (PgdA/CDA1 family)
MKAAELAKALAKHDALTRQLEPYRYVAMNTLRDGLPEAFPPRPAPPGPGEMPADGQPLTGMPGGEVEKRAKAIAGILRGEKVSDALLQELFGFNNAELDAAIKAADPVIKPLPDKLVLLTFDDATLDHYTTACPILEQYGGKANLFVAECDAGMFGRPDFSDKSVYMTWEQIAELSQRGHEVGNHSWHHRGDFQRGSADYMREEIRGLEEKCAEFGIPKPNVFAAPGGGYNAQVLDIMREMGYVWGRGDLLGSQPQRLGDALYDPYVDTPLVVPNVNPTTSEAMVEILDRAVGKVPLLVFHDIDSPMMPGVPFAELIDTIYKNGGRCITFGELAEYVDPVKADAYTR